VWRNRHPDTPTHCREGTSNWNWTKKRIAMMLRMDPKYVPISWILQPEFRLCPPPPPETTSRTMDTSPYGLLSNTRTTTPKHDRLFKTTCGVRDGKPILTPNVWLKLAIIWTCCKVAATSDLTRSTLPSIRGSDLPPPPAAQRPHTPMTCDYLSLLNRISGYLSTV
jgi:hypothetical protein